MSNPDGPVVVNAGASLAPLAAAARYAVVIAGAIPILMTLAGEGGVDAIVEYFKGEHGSAFIAAIGSLATLGYGLYKTYKTKKTLLAAATAAPNDKFVVRQKANFSKGA